MELPQKLIFVDPETLTAPKSNRSSRVFPDFRNFWKYAGNLAIPQVTKESD